MLENSKRRKHFQYTILKKLDAEKIAKLFKDRRAITPYEFAKLSIEDKSLVYKGRYVSEEGR